MPKPKFQKRRWRPIPIRDFTKLLRPEARRAYSAISRLSSTQGNLNRIITLSTRTPSRDAAYARILAQEQSIVNLFKLQKTIDFCRSGISFDTAFSSEMREEFQVRGALDNGGAFVEPTAPEVINAMIASYESAPFGFREKTKAAWTRMRPSWRIDWKHPFATWKGRSIVVVHEADPFVRYTFNRIREVRSKKPKVVVALGGLRGAGKTTTINLLKERLNAQGLSIDAIEMDAYFKEPAECKAPGGWDNPRNSHLRQLAKAINDFRKGKKITLPVGRVPRHGVIQTRTIDPAKANILLIEGIHGLESQISRQADVRGFFYIPPGL